MGALDQVSEAATFPQQEGPVSSVDRLLWVPSPQAEPLPSQSFLAAAQLQSVIKAAVAAAI